MDEEGIEIIDYQYKARLEDNILKIHIPGKVPPIKRIWDVDNRNIKPIQDGLIHGRVIKDDNIYCSSYMVQGLLYLIYTRKEIQCKLNLSDKPVIRAFKELRDIELIKEEKQGFGKLNLIYIGKIEHED